MELRIARKTRLQLRERLLGRGDRVGPHLLDGLTVGDPPPVLQGEDALYGDDLSGGEPGAEVAAERPGERGLGPLQVSEHPGGQEGVP